MNEEVSLELLEAAKEYENLFVPALFNQWTGYVLDGANVHTGAHVLDVACGTGVLARDAMARVGPSGRVVGVDPAPGMLAVGRDLEPAVDWKMATAEALPTPDESFDCVVCQFGLMFFSDRDKALQEMFRVLRSNGAVTIAVWNSLEHNRAFADVVALLDRTVGEGAKDALRAPYSLGDAGKVAAQMSSAGFSEVATKTVTCSADFPSARDIVEAELRGWLPLFDIHLGDEQIEEILAESERALASHVLSNGRTRFPISAHIISGRKPSQATS